MRDKALNNTSCLLTHANRSRKPNFNEKSECATLTTARAARRAEQRGREAHASAALCYYIPMTHQGGRYSLQQLLYYARRHDYPTERAKLEKYVAQKAAAERIALQAAKGSGIGLVFS